ncbi:hypothetical protein, partial [Salmonella enterica]|uniref:hypothetical protein n=1 Tax=Salmonella enterica TaxID=28901 RepID=UPI003299D0C8
DHHNDVCAQLPYPAQHAGSAEGQQARDLSADGVPLNLQLPLQPRLRIWLQRVLRAALSDFELLHAFGPFGSM